MDWVGWLALVGGFVALVTFSMGRRDLARADAACVYVLVTKFRAGTPTEKHPIFTTYQIFNPSRLPLLGVSPSAWTWGRRRVTWRFRRYERWMTGQRLVGRAYATIAPNGSTHEHDLPGLETVGGAGATPPVMLIFRDGHGRRWVRWPDGKLCRLYPSRYFLDERRWRRGSRRSVRRADG
jgi:hypothetical protein